MSLRALRPYGLALLATAVAVGLGLAAPDLRLGHLERPLFLIAIGVVVWYGGVGPGVATVVAGALCIDYFFTPPLYELNFERQDFINIGLFLAFALVIAGFTARRRSIERELHLAVDRLQEEVAIRTRQASLLDLTHDSIFVRDMDDVITYWNRGAEELMGWTAAQAVGKRAQELLRTVFPRPVEEIRAELLRTGRWDGELTKTKADGTQVIIASRWSLQRDAEGRPLAILDTYNDITERKRREDDIPKLKAIGVREIFNAEASTQQLIDGIERIVAETGRDRARREAAPVR